MTNKWTGIGALVTCPEAFMTTDASTGASRKVAVLGPIPRDQIVTPAGERFEKYGCALYTAVALSALLDPDDTIVPITHVRRRDEGPIKKILSAYRNIDTSGITSSHDQGDVVDPVLGGVALSGSLTY